MRKRDKYLLIVGLGIVLGLITSKSLSQSLPFPGPGGPVGGGGSVCGNSWVNCRTITLDHTLAGGADQTDFTMPFTGTFTYLKTVANGGKVNNTVSQSGGGASITVAADMIFATSATCGTKLSWEFETYSATSGVVNAWVKIPSMSSSVDTVIWLCYGKASVTTWQGDVPGTWDSNFVSVYHVPDGTTPNSVDSIGTSNGTFINSPTASAGQIDGALHTASASSQDMSRADLVTTDYQVSAWFNSADTAAKRPVYYSDTFPNVPRAGFGFSAFHDGLGSGVIEAYVNDTGGFATFSVTTGAWHYAVMVRSGTNVTGYMDNTLVGSITVGSGSTTFPNVRLGAHFFNGADQDWFNGDLDEWHLSSSARSAGWRTAEFNSQGNPGTFSTIGAEQH